jgi:hypothetical protein
MECSKPGDPDATRGTDGPVCGGIGAVSGRRVPVDQVEFVVEQYRARYWDLTVKHFPEALQGGARFLC